MACAGRAADVTVAEHEVAAALDVERADAGVDGTGNDEQTVDTDTGAGERELDGDAVPLPGYDDEELDDSSAGGAAELGDEGDHGPVDVLEELVSDTTAAPGRYNAEETAADNRDVVSLLAARQWRFHYPPNGPQTCGTMSRVKTPHRLSTFPVLFHPYRPTRPETRLPAGKRVSRARPNLCTGKERSLLRFVVHAADIAAIPIAPGCHGQTE